MKIETARQQPLTLLLLVTIASILLVCFEILQRHPPAAEPGAAASGSKTTTPQTGHGAVFDVSSDQALAANTPSKAARLLGLNVHTADKDYSSWMKPWRQHVEYDRWIQSMLYHVSAGSPRDEGTVVGR
jgi:hypothetical protein